MTHRQVKFYKSKRSRKVEQVEEEYEVDNGHRRAVLLSCSCDDVDRMAAESSRARLISHLVSKSNDYTAREFASYYRGSTRYLDPPYSITSHTNRVPIPIVKQVIPAYPSLIETPRWCPYSAPLSEQNSETDFMMDQHFTCKCEHCTSPNCPAKFSCSTLKPCRFKDNIMTFCDRYTMTLKLNDAACGRTPIPSTPKVSDVFVPCASSMIAVRDGNGKLKIHEMYSRQCPPAPILKKGCPGPVFYGCRENKVIDDYPDQAVRDVEPSTVKSLKCFFRKEDDDVGTDCDGEVVSRKNIYNEGISDVVTDKFPLCLKKKKSPPPEYSKSSASSKYYDSEEENYIPYSHRSDSKYHTSCKKSPTREFVCDNGAQRIRHHIMIPSPRLVCKPYGTRACKRCKQTPRSIKLPKKVLTSERVIDSCVDKNPRRKSPCRKK